eukprot:g314.t1
MSVSFSCFILAISLAFAHARSEVPVCQDVNYDLQTNGLDSSGFNVVEHESFVTLTWGSRNLTSDIRHFTQKAFLLSIVDDAQVNATIFNSGIIQSNKPEFKFKPSKLGLAKYRTYRWRVQITDSYGCKSETPFTKFHITDPSNVFSNAKWLGSNTSNLYKSNFTVGRTLRTHSVILSIAALGFSSISINDQYVEERFLASSPWSNNQRINGYSTVDITKYTVVGENTISVTLGYGWRKFTRHDASASDYTDRTFIAVINEITAKPSNNNILTTGTGVFKTCGQFPVTSDDVYNGQTFDARVAGGKDCTTDAQVNTMPPSNNFYSWVHSPVQILERRPSVKISQPSTGIYVVDFGSNLAGVVALKNFQCNNGSNITIRHGEIMQHANLPGLQNPNPSRVYFDNLRSAQATDVYICDGNQQKEWFPTLTYHGFRFAEIYADPAVSNFKLTSENIEMLHAHSNVPVKTEVSFLNSPVLNQIQKMAQGAQRSNFMTVPTDCDQRDERLGWMGDANLSGESMLINFNAAGFLRNFILMIRSELGDDGSLPDVVPFVRFGGRPADVSWSAVYMNLVQLLWKYEDDIDTVKDEFEYLLKHLDNVKTQAQAGLDKMHTPYGDWCPPPSKMGGGQGGKPSSPYTSAFSYLNMIKQAIPLAKALGNSSIASALTDEFNSVAKEFNAKFYHADTFSYDNGIQTALVLGVASGICPDNEKVISNLVKDIANHKGHYTTGIIGFRYLFDALYGANQSALAHNILVETDYPSIGYYFANPDEQASENLWELPDANREGTGMNSRNHHMWSSYSSYLVRRVGGVQTLSRYEYELTPASSTDLSGASTLVKLKQGDLEFKWQKHGGKHCVILPNNMSASLTCGKNGGTIEDVLFAGHGYQEGLECSQMKPSDSTCYTDQKEFVQNECIGKKECTLNPASITNSVDSSCETEE